VEAILTGREDLGKVSIVLLLLLLGGCRPPNRDMLVVNVQGDVFLPGLQASNWKVGEMAQCEIASRGSVAPDKRGDLLLCGDKTRLAWSQTWLRSDIKDQIYNSAGTLRVKFRTAGRSGGRGRSPWWRCEKTPTGIDCE